MTTIIKSQERSLCLDSIEAKAVELLFNENAMLGKVNTAQSEQIELHKANESLLNGKVDELKAIINLKDEQLKKMEGIKIPIINSSNPDWWKFALGGGIVGALVYYIFDKVVFK